MAAGKTSNRWPKSGGLIATILLVLFTLSVAGLLPRAGASISDDFIFDDEDLVGKEQSSGDGEIPPEVIKTTTTISPPVVNPVLPPIVVNPPPVIIRPHPPPAATNRPSLPRPDNYLPAQV